MDYKCFLVKEKYVSHINYIIGLLFLVILSLLIIKRKERFFKLKITRILTIFVLVILGLRVILFPELGPIASTGDFTYTKEILEVTDEGRIDPFNMEHARALSLLVYLPTSPKEEDTFPLVVFSHGGISHNRSNLSLYHELASHGYIVVSVDHTYHALSTKVNGKTIRIDSGYLQSLMKEDAKKDIEHSFLMFQEWMDVRMKDLDFVLDYLLLDSFLSAKIDADKIGLVGHSLGGSAALGIARTRSDIKGVVALESPFMYDVLGVDQSGFIWNEEPMSSPMLHIYTDSAFYLLEDHLVYAQNKRYLYNTDEVEYYHITNSNHFTITDLVRSSPILAFVLGGKYERSGKETLKIVNEKVLDFFARHIAE